MFRLMLASHNQIVIPPESEFVVKLYPKYGHIRLFSKIELSDFLADISGERALVNVEDQWQISLSGYARNIEKQLNKSYADICSSLYFYYADVKGLKGKILWGDKNNAFGNYIDVLSDLYPEARFIHIVRDGRAVMSSYQQLKVDNNQKFAPVLPKNPIVIAESWVDMVDRIDRHLQHFAPNRFIVIRYEDILEKFHEKITEVCAFLCIGYDNSMIQFNKVNIKYNLEPDHFSWKENARKPIDRSKANAWRMRLSKDVIDCFERVAAAKLRQHGYPVDANSHKVLYPSWFQFSARLREGMRGLRRLMVMIKRIMR
jgi:sulfotransferase family protein